MGSSFIIRWKAEKEVNVPVIEDVAAARTQAIFFISPGT